MQCDITAIFIYISNIEQDLRKKACQESLGKCFIRSF